jgi:CheY-like chemotaxis protein
MPLIEARKHRLTVHLPPEPVTIAADPVRLSQVLGNLLNNAAKYTEEGGRVSLSCERTANEVVLRVRDSGVGIPREKLTSVFDLFTQLDRSLDRSQGGLGVGLTLVRQLVEMHGGRVEARSDGPNQGSEFVVCLPIRAATEPPAAPAGGDINGAQVTHRRVLVVDDNVDAAESLALLLRLWGHDTRVAHDGASALAAGRNFGAEVAFLDIGLPGIDGYEVARRLRAMSGGNKIIFVALSGYSQEQDFCRSQEAGFVRHLVKPVDPTALQEFLESIDQCGDLLKFPA